MCVSEALWGPTGGLKAPPRPPALREKTTFGFFCPHHQNPLGTLILLSFLSMSIFLDGQCIVNCEDFQDLILCPSHVVLNGRESLALWFMTTGECFP